jgi:hypothetical protein
MIRPNASVLRLGSIDSEKMGARVGVAVSAGRAVADGRGGVCVGGCVFVGPEGVAVSAGVGVKDGVAE